MRVYSICNRTRQRLTVVRFATTGSRNNEPNSIEPGLNSSNARRRQGLLERFPWRILLFAWMMFLASRLALLLQVGFPLSGRLNYGAGVAVSLAAAALAGWAWHQSHRNSLSKFPRGDRNGRETAEQAT